MDQQMSSVTRASLWRGAQSVRLCRAAAHALLEVRTNLSGQTQHALLWSKMQGLLARPAARELMIDDVTKLSAAARAAAAGRARHRGGAVIGSACRMLQTRADAAALKRAMRAGAHHR